MLVTWISECNHHKRIVSIVEFFDFSTTMLAYHPLQKFDTMSHKKANEIRIHFLPNNLVVISILKPNYQQKEDPFINLKASKPLSDIYLYETITNHYDII